MARFTFLQLLALSTDATPKFRWRDSATAIAGRVNEKSLSTRNRRRAGSRRRCHEPQALGHVGRPCFAYLELLTNPEEVVARQITHPSSVSDDADHVHGANCARLRSRLTSAAEARPYSVRMHFLRSVIRRTKGGAGTCATPILKRYEQTRRPAGWISAVVEGSSRERRRLRGELANIRGAWPLLMKQRQGGSWTTEEKQRLKSMVRSATAVSPYLAIWAVPGSVLFLPLLAWYLDYRRNR